MTFLRPGKRVEEGTRCADRKHARECEQVLVAGDEDSSLRLGEREEVVVAGIGRAARGRLGVGREPHCLA